MAKRKIDITHVMQAVLKDVEGKVALAVYKEAAQKIGQVSATVIHQQMNRKGVNRAKQTGTHKKRSEKEKAKANRYGSMLDTSYKVWRAKDNRAFVVFAGQTGAGYKARFVNDGFSNHHYWGKPSGNNVARRDYLTPSRKIVFAGSKKIVEQTLKKVVAKNKKKQAKRTIG